MALQGSGSISMSQINSELGRSSTSTISLDSAENGSYATINTCSSSRPSSSNPASMSEWYSYNHTAACCPAYGTYYSQYCSGYDLYYTYHNGSCGYYSSLYESNSTTCGYVAPTSCTIWYAPYTSYFSFVGCDGIYYSEFFEANQSLCARSTNGMINSGNECFNTPY
jgi:hypothetical protein